MPYTPPMNPPNYTPTSSPWGVPPTPGPWTPPKPPQVTPPHVTYPSPPTTEFSPGATPPNPPSPTNPGAGAGGGGGGGDLWNGYRVVQRSPGGNVLVDVNGDLQAYDPWGNRIPHLYAGAAGGDPNGGAGGGGGGGGAPTTPAVPVPGLPTPPAQQPTTFYSPTHASPYLQFGNLFAYLNDNQRNQFNNALVGANFKPTGALSIYGNSDYLKPAQFDEGDIQKLAIDEPLRQWLRWYMGNMGWGQSYQLPAGYVPGSGLPTPPAYPQA